MRYTINAHNCTEYLRSIGVEVSAQTAQAWATQEKEERRRRRVHKAELKRSCGHFRTGKTTIHDTSGTYVDTYCIDCRKVLSTQAPPPSRRTPPRIA